MEIASTSLITDLGWMQQCLPIENLNVSVIEKRGNDRSIIISYTTSSKWPCSHLRLICP